MGIKALNQKACEYLARDVLGLPESILEQKFWEMYQLWQNHAEGPLAILWAEHVDEHVMQVVFEFCDLLELEWGQFCKMTVADLQKVLPEKGKFQQTTLLMHAAA